MAISNYGELKTTINTHLFHQRFVAEYDNATIKFEAAANRRLRVRQMETFVDLTTIDGRVALPSDYLLWRTVLWLGRTPNPELDYVHPAYLSQAFAGNTDPRLFTIEGDFIYIFPVDDRPSIYEFDYYQKIPSLTGSDDLATNWLITAYPDVYVEGLLTEMGALGRNMEFAQLHKARRDELFAEIIQLSALTTGASSPQVRTADYF
jgi:hypothetical protein